MHVEETECVKIVAQSASSKCTAANSAYQFS
jgi:hypothetical protein